MNKPTPNKRQPTLADALLASRAERHFALKQQWREQSMDDLMLAHKFVLDGQAATYIAMMLRDHPRIVADANDFAQRPFERMWIELPFQSFYTTMTGRPNDPTGDRRVGYLFDGPRVRVAAEGWTQHHSNPHGQWDSGFMPVEYILNRPMTLDQELDLCGRLGCSRIGLDLWYWGESAEHFAKAGKTERVLTRSKNTGRMVETLSIDDDPETWDTEAIRTLRANHTAKIAPMERRGDERLWNQVVEGSAGDLRNIIGLLLFLNRTQDIQASHAVPRAHGFIDRKPSAYHAHSVISLKVDPLPRLRKLVAGEGVRKRLHDVRGHYAHDRRARSGCQHSADPDLKGDFGNEWYEYEPLRWKCQLCGGHRWWQPEHSRGSLDAGLVRASYAVTR